MSLSTPTRVRRKSRSSMAPYSSTASTAGLCPPVPTSVLNTCIAELVVKGRHNDAPTTSTEVVANYVELAAAYLGGAGAVIAFPLAPMCRVEQACLSAQHHHRFRRHRSRTNRANQLGCPG